MTEGPVVGLRPAGPEDAVAVWSWRQDADTRRASFSDEDIALDDHLTWFDDVLGDDRRRLYIIERAGVPAGVVRFDGHGGGRWEISINLASEARGRGLGAVAISAAMTYLAGDGVAVTEVVARVRPTNTASLRVFQHVGFAVADTGDDALELKYPVGPGGP